MKNLFTACTMCFSMFCSLPSPFRKWEENARHLMLLFLPLVGLLIGGLWMGLAFLLRYFHVPQLVSGALLCAYPFVVTGFIHLDGFLDVTDAVKSWRDFEERRNILKDPHTGSFATIACGLLLMMEFALLSSGFETMNIGALVFIPVVSRCFSGLAVTILEPMESSEYAGSFRQNMSKSHVVILLLQLAVSVLLGFFCLGVSGFVSVGVMIGYGLGLYRACHSLKGMSGDVAGYCLTIGELCGLAVGVLL